MSFQPQGICQTSDKAASGFRRHVTNVFPYEGTVFVDEGTLQNPVCQ